MLTVFTHRHLSGGCGSVGLMYLALSAHHGVQHLLWGELGFPEATFAACSWSYSSSWLEGESGPVWPNRRCIVQHYARAVSRAEVFSSCAAGEKTIDRGREDHYHLLKRSKATSDTSRSTTQEHCVTHV